MKEDKAKCAIHQGLCMNDIQTAEKNFGEKIDLCDLHIMDEFFVSEFVRWSMQNHPNTVRFAII